MIDCVTGKFITNIGETFEIQLIEICNIAQNHSFDQRQKKSICIRKAENAVLVEAPNNSSNFQNRFWSPHYWQIGLQI